MKNFCSQWLVRALVSPTILVQRALCSKASVEHQQMRCARNGANQRTYPTYLALLAEDINSDWERIDAAIKRTSGHNEVSALAAAVALPNARIKAPCIVRHLTVCTRDKGTNVGAILLRTPAAQTPAGDPANP